MIPRIIAALLVLALTGCPSVKMANPANPEGDPIEVKVWGTGEVHINVPICPEGVESDDFGKCPRMTIVVKTEGMSNNFTSWIVQVVQGAIAFFGGGGRLPPPAPAASG